RVSYMQFSRGRMRYKEVHNFVPSRTYHKNRIFPCMDSSLFRLSEIFYYYPDSSGQKRYDGSGNMISWTRSFFHEAVRMNVGDYFNEKGSIESHTISKIYPSNHEPQRLDITISPVGDTLQISTSHI